MNKTEREDYFELVAKWFQIHPESAIIHAKEKELVVDLPYSTVSVDSLTK